MQTNVVSSRAIWGRGLRGEGQLIGLIDDPIDMSSCFFRDRVNNTPGPAHRKVVAYRSSSGLGAIRHGTHVAGIAAGDAQPINGGSLDSAGHAWAARISFTNVNDLLGSGVEASNFYDFLTLAHGDGARVHTNSWGDDGTTDYTTWSRDADLFTHDFEESLVKRLDKVAYIRFASVYKSFQDAEDFRDALKDLEKAPPPGTDDLFK